MSSEMRVTDAMVEAALDGLVNAGMDIAKRELQPHDVLWRGFSRIRRMEAMRAALNAALLARTEAGADGVAEPFGYFDSQGLSHAGNSTNFRWLLEQHREGKPNWGNLKLLYTHPQDASGNAEDRKALEYLMGQFDAEVHVCARCGHEDSTRDCDSAIYLRRHLGAMQQTNGGGE